MSKERDKLAEEYCKDCPPEEEPNYHYTHDDLIGFFKAGWNAREQSNWQPIESAPKGELIDLWFDDGKKGYRIPNCRWNTFANEWAQLVFTSFHEIDQTRVKMWMPIPEPPKED